MNNLYKMDIKYSLLYAGDDLDIEEIVSILKKGIKVFLFCKNPNLFKEDDRIKRFVSGGFAYFFSNVQGIELTIIDGDDYNHYSSELRMLEKYDPGFNLEQYEIEHCKRRETRICGVHEPEHDRTYAYCEIRAVRAAYGRHKVAAEDKFFTHSLNKEAEQIQCDNTVICALCNRYAVCPCRHSKQGYHGHKQCAYPETGSIMPESSLLPRAH